METSIPNAIITFPMFGEGFAISAPGTYSIFGFTLHWYGAIIAIGFLLAVIYVNKRCKEFGLKQDDIIDMLICAVPSAIVGARLYYVIFDYSQCRNNFWQIFKIWDGGIAIYGAIIGGVIAVIVFCKVKKMPIGPFLDLGAFGLLIGQAIGRWGNFMNREAFGDMTTVFCRMGLTDTYGKTYFVHPTFLYESLWNVLGLLLLHLFSKTGRRRYDGQLFAMYVAWYGFGRMFIEGLRTDSLYLFSTGLRVSQVLAGICVVGALVYLAANGSLPHDKSKMLVNIAQEEAEKAVEKSNDSKADETK